MHKRRLIYGRRQGHRLHPRQAQRIATMLPRLQPDLSLDDLSAWFDDGKAVPRLFQFALEIGFGGGEHLAARAQSTKNIGYVGCEPFINGVAKLLGHIEAQALDNVCVHHGDARDVLAAMPAASIAVAYLLYPDPWPKKRHHKRRFVNQENLHSLFRVLTPDAYFLVATDIADYADWTLAAIRAHGGFSWQAKQRRDWMTPPAGWPGTRYEQKALAAGRVPHYLEFKRRAAIAPGQL